AQNDDEPLPEDLSLYRLIEIVAASVDATALARRGDAARLRAAASGKSGAKRAASGRGRPRGVRAGDPRRDGRLDIPATLRSAAPWSRLRRKPNDAVRVKVLPGDFQIKVTEERSESVVIFVVDASGSSAMHRMGEAKGAVENLLADCYARRDHVALIAFRRDDAELLLPPTRSLVRARRALVALPGGGGTPLAAALQAALALALSERSKGRTPLIVMLTDGKANVPLAGEGDREAARRDAARLARDILRERVAGLFFDTSPRGSDAARDLSAAMGADYVALPYADGARVAETVKRAVDAPRGPAG
ncbi:MAG: VWA domain-containing protein, partial [Pseudomonadota bacterium]